MERAAKAELVTVLHEVFDNAGVVVVTHYSGLSVAQMTDYRNRMRAAGGTVKVAKNRLAKIALKDTKLGDITEFLKGPTCLSYSDDPIAAAKIAVEYAKGMTSSSFSAVHMGSSVLDADGVKALAALPSLDELRGTLVGLIQAPATKIARIAKEPADSSHVYLQAKSRGRATRPKMVTNMVAGLRWSPKRIAHLELNRFKLEGSNTMTDLAKIVDDLSALTVLEAAELSKMLEEKWGVSASAAVAVAAAPGAAAGGEAAGREDGIHRHPEVCR